MPEGLQLILGADNKNEFTIYKDTTLIKHIGAKSSAFWAGEFVK